MTTNETYVSRLMEARPHCVMPNNVLTPVPAATPAFVYWQELDFHEEAPASEQYAWTDGVLPALAYGLTNEGLGCVMVLVDETGPRWVVPFIRNRLSYLKEDSNKVTGSLRVLYTKPEFGIAPPVWLECNATYLGPDAFAPGWSL